ncbi:MAG: hypothetical protein HKN56_08650 [Gammaproteobacteria bacterium]|nr:hypothetical protein [Gammaproteobacteria bacterium]
MKILHLVEKGSGLQQSDEGHLESFIWPLDADEQSAEYVALHKQKSQRSWKGGRVVGMREATDDEISAAADDKNLRKGKIVVQFVPMREYNGRPGVRWGGGRRGSMAYKSLEETKN